MAKGKKRPPMMHDEEEIDGMAKKGKKPGKQMPPLPKKGKKK